MKILKAVLFVIIVMLLTYWFLEYAAWRDAHLEAYAKVYEECVEGEYGMSPVEWYAKHGEYPYCLADKVAQ